MKKEYRVKAGEKIDLGHGCYIREGVVVKLEPEVAKKHKDVLEEVKEKRDVGSRSD